MIHLLLDYFASASQVNEQQNRESKDKGTTAERGWGEQKREGVNELAGRGERRQRERRIQEYPDSRPRRGYCRRALNLVSAVEAKRKTRQILLLAL